MVCGLQVMLVRVGVRAVLHDCVTLARQLSPHGKLMDKDDLTGTLGLPNEEAMHVMTMSGTLRTNMTRPQTAYSKQLAQVRHSSSTHFSGRYCLRTVQQRAWQARPKVTQTHVDDIITTHVFWMGDACTWCDADDVILPADGVWLGYGCCHVGVSCLRGLGSG